MRDGLLRVYWGWVARIPRKATETPVAGLARAIGSLMPHPPQTPQELALCVSLTEVITAIYEGDRSPQSVQRAILAYQEP